MSTPIVNMKTGTMIQTSLLMPDREACCYEWSVDQGSFHAEGYTATQRGARRQVRKALKLAAASGKEN